MLARELLRAVRQIVSQVELVGMDVVEVVAAVRPRRDHRDPRAPHRDGGDQRARREAAMSAASDGELADNRKLWDAWTAIHTTGDVLRRPAVPRRPRPTCGSSPGSRRRSATSSGKTPAPSAVPFRARHVVVGAPRAPGTSRASTSASRRSRSRTSSRPRPGSADRARFVVSDIYDLPGPLAGETFDVVYTGRGALGWLPELRPWARARRRVRSTGRHLLHPRGAPGDVGDRRRAGHAERPAARVRLLGRGDAVLPRGGLLRGSDRRGRRRGGARLESLPRRDRDRPGATKGSGSSSWTRSASCDWPAPFLVELPNGHYGFPDDQAGNLPLMYSLRARKE